MISFKPVESMLVRVNTSKEDSDVAYFYDLILYGELVTKVVALYMVSNVCDDIDRNRYRYEYKIVRTDGIGDFAMTINDVIIGNASNSLCKTVFDKELMELRNKAIEGTWQRMALTKLSSCLKALGIEASNLTSKSSLSLWFSMFATLRNKTKGHGAMTSDRCSSVVVDLRDSIDLIYQNLSVFARPWAYLKQNLSGKYRVSQIGGNSSAFDHLKRTNTEHLQEGVYCYTDGPMRVNLVYSSPELLSFKFVNGNFNDNNKTFEILDYVEDSKERLDGSAYIITQDKLPDSITSGRDGMVVSGDSFTNLPLINPDYIERKELEEELYRVLMDKERFPVVTLKGRGGIGKTSLAVHVIDSISKTNRFDIIVWFSARDVDLLTEGPKQVQTVVISKHDIAAQYFRLIYPNEKIPKDTESQFANKLTKNELGRALYVFDNFETLQNPVEIFEWINTYIRLENKILITSRLSRNFKADYPIEVCGMNESQCRSLISATAKRFCVEDLLTEGYITRLIDESDGHPYIIKIILGEVAKFHRLTDIQRIVADQDRILDALFKRTYSTLSYAAKRIFLTLCSWRSTIPMLALEAVILRSDNEKIDVEKAVDELNKSSFVELIDVIDDTLISVPLVASVFGKKELEVSPEKLRILQDRKLLMEFGAGTTRGIANIERHVFRKISAVASRIQTKEELLDELPTLECLANKYVEAWIKIAELEGELGWHEKELESYRTYLQSCTDYQRKIQIWNKISEVACSIGDWKNESSALIEIVQNPVVEYWMVSNVANRINNYYSTHNDTRDPELKKILICAVLQVMERRINEANAVDCSRLSWLYLNTGNEVSALKYAQMGCSMDSTNGHCRKLLDKLSNIGKIHQYR